ncbi:MAG: hypothetical protein Q8P18_28715 [Pseudomonadota bacterium]|nr:hypothetical protein [Pseudomonadota bacterium]
MLLSWLLACTNGATKDDTAQADDSAAGRDFTLAVEGGGTVDYSAEAAAGTEAAPAAIVLDQPGVLTVGAGTWFVMLDVTVPLTIVGAGSVDALPVLSAGGKGVVISVSAPVALTVEDIAITGGFGCLGQAIRSGVVLECNRESVTAVPVDLTLRRVDIHDNVFDIGGGAVGVTAGSTVLVEDSNIHENTGHAIYGQMADVTCRGVTGAQAGLWGNGKNGVWIEIFDDSPHSIVSENCDFGEGASDNGHDDVGFNETLAMDYGDDATFTCDSASSVCQ